MKRVKIGIVCMAALLLTGCGVEWPDMTEEQANAISEYAAITLLKYDANARSRLVDPVLLAEKPSTAEEIKQEVTPEPEPEPVSPEVPVIEIQDGEGDFSGSMEEFLEFPEGMSLQFVNHTVCQSYQGDDNQYFSMEASEGKSLLVLQFALQNNTGSAREVNLLSRRDVYQITVNGSDTRTALPTILTNDLATYVGTVGDGATKDVVLLIELSSEKLTTVDSISLNLKNESKRCTIQLL